MKKALALLFAAVMILSMVACGKKTVEEEGYDVWVCVQVIENGTSNPGTTENTLKYNESQNKLEWECLQTETGVLQYYSYFFEDGCLIKEERITKNNPKNKSNELVVYSFDENGNITAITTKGDDYAGEYTESNCVRTYNEKGLMATENYINSSGKTTQTNVYQYDQQDRLVYKQYIYKYSTESYADYFYTYDEKGRLQEEQNYLTYSGERPATPDYVITYTYDDADHLIEEKKTDEEGNVTATVTYTYEGDVLVLSVDEQISGKRKIETTYDEDGKMIGYKWYDYSKGEKLIHDTSFKWEKIRVSEDYARCVQIGISKYCFDFLISDSMVFIDAETAAALNEE